MSGIGLNSLFFIVKASFKNQLKKALRRPITYFYTIFLIGYGILMIYGLSVLAKENNFNTIKELVIILSGLTLFTVPANLIIYAKRSGVWFKNSYVHFLFPAPIDPRLVLQFGQLKNYVVSILFNVAISIAGVFIFHARWWIMIIYLVVAYGIEVIIDACLLTLLYGNETLSEKTISIMTKILFAIVGILGLFAAYLFFVENTSFGVISVFLNHPFLQCIPIVGWNIAFMRLLLLGPNLLNVICTICYILFAGVLVWYTLKMKCTGQFYEEAARSADIYEKRMAASKEGKIELSKKKKLKKASIVYKGYFAKAIFYKQMLEYKKERFFIFGGTTLLFLGIGIAAAYYFVKSNELGPEIGQFAVPVISSYITFILSGHKTKWEKELENPYTFLIPDTSARKLWYATVFEHIRAIVDGILLTLPIAIVLRMSPLLVILNVFIHFCLQASRLYSGVLSQALLGNLLGKNGRQFCRMMIQGVILSGGVVLCVVGYMLTDKIEIAYMMLIVYSLIATIIIGVWDQMCLTESKYRENK